MTTAVRSLILAMLGQAAECAARGDWQRAEGWCAGAWDLIEDARIEFIDTDEEAER